MLKIKLLDDLINLNTLLKSYIVHLINYFTNIFNINNKVQNLILILITIGQK